MSDSFLSTAGSLFFAVWALIVGALSAVVFARDLLPVKKPLDPIGDTRRMPPARKL